jgi:hypothetical protein
VEYFSIPVPFTRRERIFLVYIAVGEKISHLYPLIEEFLGGNRDQVPIATSSKKRTSPTALANWAGASRSGLMD